MDGTSNAPGAAKGTANEVIGKMTTCFFEAVKEQDVERETAELMTFLKSDEWITAVEHGTKQEFIDEFGDAIDPLTEKMMGAYGPDVVQQMPTEMHAWIKDSTILWIKNQGAGNPTTEGEVLSEAEMQKNRNSAKAVKEFYEEKVMRLTQNIVDLGETNKQYKYEIS